MESAGKANQTKRKFHVCAAPVSPKRISLRGQRRRSDLRFRVGVEVCSPGSCGGLALISQENYRTNTKKVKGEFL